SVTCPSENMSTMHEKLERMTQEEILVRTVVVIQGLEALKSDHDFMLHNLTETIKCLNEGEMAGLVHEKFSLLQTSVDKIKLGLEEAKVMTALAANLRELELEKCELQLQVCQLEQEKMQLKEHVNYVQEKLQTSEQNFAQVEEEKNHLQFMNELKQYNLEPFLENGEDEEILQNNLDELFPNEEETNQEATPEQEGSMAIAAAQQEDDRVPGHLKTLHNLVIRYAQKGHYEVAVPLCKQTLASLERTLGHDHPDVATMLNVLALVYRPGKHEEASRLLYDVVAIRMKTLGEEHPMVAGTLNNLSVQYGKIGRFIEAEPICKRALELKEKVLGIDHPEVAKQLNNLGLICEKQEKYEEVESYLCRAIDIYEKNLCQDDPQFDKTKNNLASCYLKQGKYKEAEILYKEILTRAHKKEFGTVDGE
ncbi:kinesin light chain 4, partial [Silurus meridionalis]